VLLLVIHNSPALLGVILASWFIVFGVFGMIHAQQDGGNKPKARISALLALIGVVLILLPFLIGIDHVIFLGIVSILIGVVRTTQGIIYKVQRDERTSGGRSNLI
jgi:predicted membrane channel-forming protein YqfA (hemolysin III family)